jgi:short-subunit dehydrogenase
MTSLVGKTVAITGGARGIGYATAKALLSQKARVVIGDRDVGELKTAVVQLASLGAVSGHGLDVTDAESFSAFLDAARADGSGRIDVLINNAGVMPAGPFLELSQQAIRSAVEVNFFGVLHGCQAVLPEMVARGSGHIINVASLAGLISVPGQTVYAGTKFAVVGLSTGLADEFAPRGVDVTVVMPTFTNTELISGATTTWATRPVEPDDVAAAVVKAAKKPKTHVSVPTALRFTAALVSMLGPRGRRWFSKRLGTDHVFLELDETARRPYEDRTRNCQGVTEHDD